jgi:tetratricopeptide (TPR) repeat protein
MPKTTFPQKILLILFGLFLCLLLLELGLRVAGFVLSSIQEHRNKVELLKKDAYQIMCIGESTTAGQYPQILEEILNQRNIGVRFSVIDKGIPGVTTAAILNRLEYNLDTYNPDIVIAMMGINDSGERLPYNEFIAGQSACFLKCLKVYKLGVLLWLHMKHKLKEVNKDFLGKNREDLGRILPGLKSYILEKAYAQPEGRAANQKSVRVIAAQTRNEWVYISQGEALRQQGELAQAELMFRKALQVNPHSDLAYAELGHLFRAQGRFNDAEESYKRSLAISPGNDALCVDFADFYQGLGKLQEAAELLNNAIAINPNDGLAYSKLGQVYRKQGRPAEAEVALKNAVALNPKDAASFRVLGWLYRENGNLAKAEESLKNSLAVSPDDQVLYTELGQVYQEESKFSEAEEAFKKAIMLNPDKELIYANLVALYKVEKKFAEAEKLLKGAIVLYPEKDWFYRALSVLYRDTGRLGLAERYIKKAKRVRLGYVIPERVENFRKLKEMLDRRGIILVCVQYPMRGIKPLKQRFQDPSGIIFVDNENIFKDAVKKEGHKAYFTDMFGGDFGHCTPKGNRLLAANIANVILKEVFNK